MNETMTPDTRNKPTVNDLKAEIYDLIVKQTAIQQQSAPLQQQMVSIGNEINMKQVQLQELEADVPVIDTQLGE